MKSLFWKTYYRLKFGQNYQNKIDSAAVIFKSINASTCGGTKYRFDSSGKPTREIHKPIPRSACFNDENPLVTKYGH